MSEFEMLVKDMRNAQKSYFLTRGKEFLQEAKKLEKEVDKKLKGMEQGLSELGTASSEHIAELCEVVHEVIVQMCSACPAWENEHEECRQPTGTCYVQQWIRALKKARGEE